MTRDLTVFICGTFADLQAEREAVLQAAEAVRVKYDAMEYFGARHGRPLEVCLDEVRRSDLLIVIVGHRYGTIAPELGISFSEAEYRVATEANKPCYVFMASDEVPVPPKDTEQDPDKLRKLQEWKKILFEHHTVAFFKSPTELAVRVVAALTRVLEAQSMNEAPPKASAKSSAREIATALEEMIIAALATGYTPGVLTATLRAALATFIKPKEALGVKILLLSGGRYTAVRTALASALEAEGADVFVEPLGNRQFSPGQLTELLESVEVVIVLTSGGPLPEPSVLHEIEAAIWRFLLLPESVEILPVSIDGAAVPPLLRARPRIALKSDNASAGIEQIMEALRSYRAKRDARGARIARAGNLLRRPA